MTIFIVTLITNSVPQPFVVAFVFLSLAWLFVLVFGPWGVLVPKLVEASSDHITTFTTSTGTSSCASSPLASLLSSLSRRNEGVLWDFLRNWNVNVTKKKVTWYSLFVSLLGLIVKSGEEKWEGKLKYLYWLWNYFTKYILSKMF